MESLKLAFWGAGCFYEKLKASGLLDNVKIDLLIDRDPAKGASPETLRNGKYDFVLITTEWFNNEIHRELLGMGIKEEQIIPVESVTHLLCCLKYFGSMDRKKFRDTAGKRGKYSIPSIYYDIQFQHFLKYRYFAEWESMINQSGKAQVVCNWFHEEDSVSSVLLIKKILGRRITISAFSFSGQDVVITDLRANHECTRIHISDDGTGNETIAADTDEMLLKITCRGCDVPHITLDLSESNWYQALASEIPNDSIRKNFEIYMQIQSTQFPYHEEDYLLLRNFADVKNLVMLDCGANYGQSAYFFLRATKYMRVFSFEADPQLIQGLRILENKTDRLKVFHVGVGAQKGTLRFYSCRDGNAAGSFVLDDLKARIEADREIVEALVPVERLDDILPEDVTVHFAKLDVEGIEYEAICGFMKHIRRDRPVLLIEENRCNAEKIKELLKDSYTFYYYDYTQNRLLSTNKKNSLNYWAIPKGGTTNQEVNCILEGLI